MLSHVLALRQCITSITALRAQFSITVCQSVTSCLSYSEHAPLQRCSSIQCIVTIHKCHQQSSVSVSVSCSKRLLHVNAVYSQNPLSQREEMTADEAIGVKKGEIYVVFQPPFLSI